MAQTKQHDAKRRPPPRKGDGRPELDPKKPPVADKPAPDHEKGRPKDTGRYGA